VEDDNLVRGLSRRALDLSGYNVLEASNGEEALRVAGEYEGHIDLLLTDVIMPQISGITSARLIGLTRPRIKVLYVSGYTDEAIMQRGVLESGTNFLQKPFTPDVLVSKVREVLDAPVQDFNPCRAELPGERPVN
jgi:DNA-binding response OmpR family regulator